MNTTDLINHLSEQTGYPKSQVKEIFTVLMSTFSDNLTTGNDVRVRGFGTFKIQDRSARIGRNPTTGEAIKIPESKFVRFVPSVNIKSSLKSLAQATSWYAMIL